MPEKYRPRMTATVTSAGGLSVSRKPRPHLRLGYSSRRSVGGLMARMAGYQVVLFLVTVGGTGGAGGGGGGGTVVAAGSLVGRRQDGRCRRDVGRQPHSRDVSVCVSTTNVNRSVHRHFARDGADVGY